MARQIHWQVPFVALNGTSYTINIYEEDYTGSIVTLKGGAEPFTIDEEDTDDIFQPSITSTGYLRIIDTEGIADDLRPSSQLSRYVELKSGNLIVWTGFIKVEEYSGEWGPLPQTIEYPVVSSLGILGEIPYETEHGLITIGKMIKKALSKNGVSYTDIYIPDNAGADVLKFTSYDKVFDKNDEEDVHYTGINPNLVTPEEKTSCLKVLEEIAKFYGWQLRESYGYMVTFSATDATLGYNFAPYSTLETGQIVTHGSNSPINLPAVASANHERTVLASFGQVRISHEAPESKTEVFKFDSILNTLDYLGSQFFINQPGGTRPNYAINRYLSNELVQWSEGTNPWGPGTLFMYNGLTQADLLLQSFGIVCRDSYIRNNSEWQKAVNLTPTITIGYGNASDLTTPVVTIKSPDYYDFTGRNSKMMIDFKMSAIGMTYQNEWWHAGESGGTETIPRYRIGFEKTNGEKLYYYYDVPTEAGWRPYYDAPPRPAGGTYYSTYNREPASAFCKGMAIPVPSGCGRFVIYFYGGQPTIKDPVRDTLKYVRITDIQLKVVPYFEAIDWYDRRKDGARYNEQLNATSKDVYSQECVLQEPLSDNMDVLRYGIVFPTEETYVFPVAANLQRMRDWMIQRREKLTVEVQGCTFISNSRISYNGEEYIIGARCYSYRENKTKLSIFKI